MNESAINAKEFVMAYLETCERKDFKSARSYVSDNMSYVRSIGSFFMIDASCGGASYE
jgi:hypothetical protein